MTITAVCFKRSKDSKWEAGLCIEYDAAKILDSSGSFIKDLYDLQRNDSLLSINLEYVFNYDYE